MSGERSAKENRKVIIAGMAERWAAAVKELESNKTTLADEYMEAVSWIAHEYKDKDLARIVISIAHPDDGLSILDHYRKLDATSITPHARELLDDCDKLKKGSVDGILLNSANDKVYDAWMALKASAKIAAQNGAQATNTSSTQTPNTQTANLRVPPARPSRPLAKVPFVDQFGSAMRQLYDNTKSVELISGYINEAMKLQEDDKNFRLNLKHRDTDYTLVDALILRADASDKNKKEAEKQAIVDITLNAIRAGAQPNKVNLELLKNLMTPEQSAANETTVDNLIQAPAFRNLSPDHWGESEGVLQNPNPPPTLEAADASNLEEQRPRSSTVYDRVELPSAGAAAEEAPTVLTTDDHAPTPPAQPNPDALLDEEERKLKDEEAEIIAEEKATDVLAATNVVMEKKLRSSSDAAQRLAPDATASTESNSAAARSRANTSPFSSSAFIPPTTAPSSNKPSGSAELSATIPNQPSASESNAAPIARTVPPEDKMKVDIDTQVVNPLSEGQSADSRLRSTSETSSAAFQFMPQTTPRKESLAQPVQASASQPSPRKVTVDQTLAAAPASAATRQNQDSSISRDIQRFANLSKKLYGKNIKDVAARPLISIEEKKEFKTLQIKVKELAESWKANNAEAQYQLALHYNRYNPTATENKNRRNAYFKAAAKNNHKQAMLFDAIIATKNDFPDENDIAKKFAQIFILHEPKSPNTRLSPKELDEVMKVQKKAINFLNSNSKLRDSIGEKSQILEGRNEPLNKLIKNARDEHVKIEAAHEAALKAQEKQPSFFSHLNNRIDNLQKQVDKVVNHIKKHGPGGG